ncbi:MAG: translation initiation factor IF-3 [Clostridia bacterium]|nr:translation initiation factor IF-3 [Clostridia bacterium]MBR2327225.1 translation initiation factor IF-3 [Clostridia bacterium]
MNNNKKEHLINDEIKDKEVRVIGNDGSQMGIMKIADALAKADEAGLDLVRISPNAVPPVCKIMDYGKFCFEQIKKQKEAKKNQKVVDIKEIQLSVKIDTHDFETKKNHALRFLKGGDKVKVSIRFRGREMAHTDLGVEVINRFLEGCSEIGVVEKPAKVEGRNAIAFLAPKPENKKA